MAIDLMRCADAEDQIAESPALRLSFSPASSSGRAQSPADCGRTVGPSPATRRGAVSILNRTGHARFRRGPTTPSTSPPPPPPAVAAALDMKNLPPPEAEAGASTAGSSFLSAEEAEGSVSSGRRGALPGTSAPLLAPAPSVGKPPLPSFSSPPPYPKKRKCEHSSDVVSGGRSPDGPCAVCHCSSSKRASKAKKTVRVPAISSKAADVPADEFSWRKYGQKPIKGSPYPRGYYRCSAVKGCPARKHVERAPDDPATLLVTYEGDHVHCGPAIAATPPRAGDRVGAE